MEKIYKIGIFESYAKFSKFEDSMHDIGFNMYDTEFHNGLNTLLIACLDIIMLDLNLDSDDEIYDKIGDIIFDTCENVNPTYVYETVLEKAKEKYCAE